MYIKLIPYFYPFNIFYFSGSCLEFFTPYGALLPLFDQKNILLPLTDLAAGVRVKVLSEAFWEFNGQVETLLQGDCTQLLLEFMGQTTRVDIANTEFERF